MAISAAESARRGVRRATARFTSTSRNSRGRTTGGSWRNPIMIRPVTSSAQLTISTTQRMPTAPTTRARAGDFMEQTPRQGEYPYHSPAGLQASTSAIAVSAQELRTKQRERTKSQRLNTEGTETQIG